MSLPPEQFRTLSGSALFSGAAQDRIEEILCREGCMLRRYSPGAVIYRPDDFLRSLGILLTGQVRVTKEPLTVSVLQPGALFGAAALYNDMPRYAAALTALSPCTVLLLSQELLDRLLGEEALLRQNYLSYLSGRIRFLNARLQALAAGGAAERLSRYLQENLTDGKLVCPVTELVRRLGVSRASLYRAMGQLEEAGLIHRQGKTITVPDPAALGCAP